tara:strand:+ start:11900 stop:12325 length:426 start_codon:yes stop_codon:yes gene_type:complete
MAEQKGLPTPGRLSLLSEASLSGNPCLGVCSTSTGDRRCSGCGRWQKEITNWSSYSEVERKLINIKNVSDGFTIRQLSDEPNHREEKRMNCWHCNNKLIWGGDHDIEDEDDEYSVVSNLSCSICGSFVNVYFPKNKEEEEK